MRRWALFYGAVSRGARVRRNNWLSERVPGPAQKDTVGRTPPASRFQSAPGAGCRLTFSQPRGRPKQRC